MGNIAGNTCGGDHRRGQRVVSYKEPEKIPPPRCGTVPAEVLSELSLDDIVTWVVYEWPWAYSEAKNKAAGSHEEISAEDMNEVRKQIESLNADELLDFKSVVYASAQYRKYKVVEALFNALDLSRSGSVSAQAIADQMDVLMKINIKARSINAIGSPAAMKALGLPVAGESSAVFDREGLSAQGMQVVKEKMLEYSASAKRRGLSDEMLRDEFHHVFQEWTLEDVHKYTHPSAPLGELDLILWFSPDIDLNKIKKQLITKAQAAQAQDGEHE